MVLFCNYKNANKCFNQPRVDCFDPEKPGPLRKDEICRRCGCGSWDTNHGVKSDRSLHLFSNKGYGGHKVNREHSLLRFNFHRLFSISLVLS